MARVKITYELGLTEKGLRTLLGLNYLYAF